MNTMHPLTYFGLQEGASASDVKRAYALRLRTTRPDEDAEAFQALNAQYQAALASLQQPVREVVAPPPTQPTPAPQPVVAPVETFDFDAFMDQLVVELHADDNDRLRAWLESNQALWSLQLKQAVGPSVVQGLSNKRVEMRDTQFDTLMQFFGMDRVDRNVDHGALAQFRRRSDLQWNLYSPRRFQWYMRQCGVEIGDGDADSTLRQLTRPFSYWQAWFRALWPQFAAHMRHAILCMVQGGREPLPPEVPEAQARFWMAATTHTMSWVKLQLVAARSALFALAICGPMLLIDGINAPVAFAVAGSVFGALVGWVLLAAALRGYFEWQSAPESVPTRWPFLRTMWVPILALSAVLATVIGFDSAWVLIGMGLSAFSLITAAKRYQGRIGLDHAAAFYVIAIMFAYLAFVVALMMWARDAFRFRRELQWKWRAA